MPLMNAFLLSFVYLSNFIVERLITNAIQVCKLKEAHFQVEQLTTELSIEHSFTQKFDGEKQSLEKQNHDLKAKITELASNAQTCSRAQLAALEARIQYLEEQLAAESADRNNATRATRRFEKRFNECTLQLEDERKTVEQQKEIAEQSNLRAKALRRQLDELEEEMTRERTKNRCLSRHIDDLNEAIDTITRENTNLRGGAARRNRETARLQSYQIPGSSENLTKNEADDDSIGAEEFDSLHIDDKKSVV